MQFCGPLARDGLESEEWRAFKLKLEEAGRPEIQLRGYGWPRSGH
jgi:hypothetical protein